MNPTRIWTLAAAAAVVAICGGAIGLGVQPALAAASASDTSAAQVQQTNSANELQLGQLARVAATESTLVAEESRLGSAATGSLRLNTFSRQLRDIAALDGVTISSLTPSIGLPYTSPLAAPVSDATTTSGTSASASPSPSPTATVAAAAPTPGQFGTADPLITSSNFTVIPITVIVTGSEAAGIQFASDVQHMRRLFAVSTVTYAKGTDATEQPTTTISGNIYALKN